MAFIKMKKIIDNLRQNGFKAISVKNKNEALAEAKKLFQNVKTVGLGGSKSVIEIGLVDWLREQENLDLLDWFEEGISKEKNAELRLASLSSDILVTSSNAITESGYLINVDGTGNRVAGQIYGPKKVLLIVGKNKIVKDVEEGFARIDKEAAPPNVERLNAKSIKYGKEPRYTNDNIQNIFCVIKKSTNTQRINIILVDEVLGF